MTVSNSALAVRDDQFISIGKAASLLGVSQESLRQWERSGQIECYRTPSGFGHRRYRLGDLKKALGVQDAEGQAEKKIALYVRVSHQSQAANLERQKQRLIKEVCKRENVSKKELVIYSEIASSFGNRQRLNRMVDDICEGKITKVYAEHADRLSRVASLTRLIEHLCKKHSVEIAALDREDNPDQWQSNLAELLEFTHVISCRTIARRTAERRKKKLDPETLVFLKQHVEAGWGVGDLTNLLNRRGFKTECGSAITTRVVGNYVRSMDLVSGKPAISKNSFAQFAKKHLRKKKGKRTKFSVVLAAYKTWCRSNSETTPLIPQKVSHRLTANGIKRETNQVQFLVDVALKGYSSETKN